MVNILVQRGHVLYQTVCATSWTLCFSVYRVQQLLSCYDSSHPCAIGERYGYNLQSENGYNYITGGGGIVLSKAAVFKFWKAEKMCSCPSGSTPDDMFLLGVCLHRLNITLVHLPRFHQVKRSFFFWPVICSDSNSKAKIIYILIKINLTNFGGRSCHKGI